ncbi:hypothetical protein KY348_05780 [Candidatus Woesearchaeota archaeon]|nr:hypothetical protein [Candidatus Woesearchaeota archaeon]
MSIEVLRKVGLSEGEIRIYNALLELGSSTTNKIHEKTGIERRNIYDILNKLIERGLVSYTTENRRRFFQTTHPKKIAGYIDEQKHDLERIKEEVEKEIPVLTKKYEFKHIEIRAEVYRGLEGIKAVFEDILNYKKAHFIGGGGYIADKLPFFWSGYNKRRIKAKSEWYNLALKELRKHLITKEKIMHTKYLPKEFSGNPTVVFIYGNKIANVLWGKEFFAFVIESKEIADSYRRYHKYLWENVAKS